jgi:hypothetical protein
VTGVDACDQFEPSRYCIGTVGIMNRKNHYCAYLSRFDTNNPVNSGNARGRN